MKFDEILKDFIIIDGHTDIPRDVFLRESRGEKDAFRSHYTELKKAGVNIVFANIFTKGSKEISLIEGLLEVEKLYRITEEYEATSPSGKILQKRWQIRGKNSVDYRRG